MRAYHGVLEKLKIRPHRSLDDDMQLQTGVMSYGGRSASKAESGRRKAAVEWDEHSESHVGSPLQRTLSAQGPLQRTHRMPATASDKQSAKVERPRSNADHQCACKTTTASTIETQNPEPATANPDAAPDFARMSRAEKLAYHQRERDRIYGKIG